MPGTVRYRYFPESRMPYGPICIYTTPTGDVYCAVDDSTMDPLLGPAIADMFNNGLMRDLGIKYAPLPDAEPMWRVRVHRDHALGGARLVEADLTASTLNLHLPYELIKKPAAIELGRHSTCATRRFVATSRRYGQLWPPPRYLQER